MEWIHVSVFIHLENKLRVITDDLGRHGNKCEACWVGTQLEVGLADEGTAHCIH